MTTVLRFLGLLVAGSLGFVAFAFAVGLAIAAVLLVLFPIAAGIFTAL